ncbi:MAG: hypothetical protein ACP5N1_01535 [Candidatus Woesearchaeota archaeon]
MNTKNYLPIRGGLLNSAKKLELKTILCSREIQSIRLDNNDFHKIYSCTSDTIIYRIENSECIIYLPEKDYNPIFKNISALTEAVNQIYKTNSYFPKKSEISSIIMAESTQRIRLQDLELKNDIIGSYFDIYTASRDDNRSENYDLLNSNQKIIAEKLHGLEKDFGKTMKMLNNSGILKTKIYLLNPYAIRKILSENNSKSFMSVAFIDSFDYNSNIHTFYWDIKDEYGSIIGIPNKKSSNL